LRRPRPSTARCRRRAAAAGRSLYEKLVAAEPDSVEGFFDLGQVDGQLRQTHNAISAFGQILHIDPLNREAAIAL
jgi:hypothetical protein